MQLLVEAFLKYPAAPRGPYTVAVVKGTLVYQQVAPGLAAAAHVLLHGEGRHQVPVGLPRSSGKSRRVNQFFQQWGPNALGSLCPTLAPGQTQAEGRSPGDCCTALTGVQGSIPGPG
jgi:hypothetical protein